MRLFYSKVGLRESQCCDSKIFFAVSSSAKTAEREHLVSEDKNAQ